MFGEFAISERSIAAHGILAFGSATADANFTATQIATNVSSGVSQMEAISSISRFSSGILVGVVETSFDFTKSAALLRKATGISAQVFSTTQSTSQQLIANVAAEQSANFTQESDGVAVRSASSENVHSFTKSSNGNIVFSGRLETDSAFTKDILGGVVTTGTIDNSFTFDFDETAGILIYRNDFNVEYVFIQATDGALLWEKINADTPAEAWTQISVSGGTWTPVNANGTIETWIQKVV